MVAGGLSTTKESGGREYHRGSKTVGKKWRFVMEGLMWTNHRIQQVGQMGPSKVYIINIYGLKTCISTLKVKIDRS